MIQSLLMAFRDPDHYSCTWWALGVWLGSSKRKLPRTPAVFDRKTKWKFQEPGEDERSDWQRNYSSITDHVALVESSERVRSFLAVVARERIQATCRPAQAVL